MPEPRIHPLDRSWWEFYARTIDHVLVPDVALVTAWSLDAVELDGSPSIHRRRALAGLAGAVELLLEAVVHGRAAIIEAEGEHRLSPIPVAGPSRRDHVRFRLVAEPPAPPQRQQHGGQGQT